LIKLACNYLDETKELVLSDSIDIDYFKFPALKFQMNIFKDFNKFMHFMSNLNTIKPVLLHGLYPADSICSPNFKKNFNIHNINKILEISMTPGISVHFGAKNNTSKNTILKSAIINILFIKETFKNYEFISIENLEKNNSIYVLDPKIISKVVHETNCQFLLDISHAFWSAKFRNENFFDYIKALPLDKIYEIHINGWEEKNGDMMAHIKINDFGYEALKYILDFCSPKIITLEYGRTIDKLGIGCPLVKPNNINEFVKDEIVEQIIKLQNLLKKY
jgi:uncharacterized protein (UPF0276 family)